MNDFPIFISSSDSYSDLWPTFFELFKKYWPEFTGEIYLNSEHKEFSYDGLNINCTKVGELETFGKVFRAGLDQINSSFLLLIMIDYFFMAKVNNTLVQEYFDFFKNKNLDSFCMINQNYRYSEKVTDKLSRVIPPSNDLFSFQIAFWQKDKLKSMVLPTENPWTAEWFGTKRANRVKLKLAFPDKNKEPIAYLPEGALHKGRWVDSIITFLESEGFNLNYEMRGRFIEKKQTYVDRLKFKYILYRSALRSFVYNMKMLFRNS